jgi:tRNA G18 (ribose-2'-O)-methylase SpoU
MAGRVASLNAATAGALLLFEVVRQRGLPDDGAEP